VSDLQTTMTGHDDVRELAIDAAMDVFHPMVLDRVFVAAALDAAGEVFAAADAAEVDRVLTETGLVGMEPVSDGVRIRLKHAHDLAAGMVSAFDALIQQKGCENYREWDYTVTDPAEGHRRYTFFVVRPGGRTPHQLREDAERERDAAIARMEAAHDALARIDDGDDDAFNTLESTVEYVVARYRAVAASEEQAADQIDRDKAELNAIADLAYRAGAADAADSAGRDAIRDALATIQTRARRAAQAR